ncbi:MAG TPA: hypothetical protein VM532_15370 [Burkholderiales bacterium]|nr:hypothetical protein [Burkholderiales bacterium]
MGARSYLMVDSGQGYVQLLEANNVLPLLWLCILARADVGDALDASGPTLRLIDGAAYGVTVPGPAALANLERRREMLAPWLGKGAPTIFKDFAKFLTKQKAQHVHLDIAEWVDASNNEQEAVAELRALIEALDTPAPKSLPAKQRPKHIEWLLEHYEVAALSKNPYRFSYMLGGGSESIVVPWRREAPRDRRLPGDSLYWSNSDPKVSNNGRTIVVKVKNSAQLDTPLVWSRDSNTSIPFPIDPSIGHLFVHQVSDDGRVIFGSGEQHPGPVKFVFRYDGAQFQTSINEVRPSAVIYGCSSDGSLAVGCHDSGEYGDNSERAFFWRPGHAEVEFLNLEVPSTASHVTPDGAFIAGCYSPGSLEDKAPQRAFVWSEAGGINEIGAACYYIAWLAISPDGNRGVLQAVREQGAKADCFFWRRGEALRRIEDANGESLTRLKISVAVDAVLGDFSDGKGSAGAVLLWRPDQPVSSIPMPGDGTLLPQFVADGGSAVVVGLEDPSTYSPREMLIWTEEDGLRVSSLQHEGKTMVGGIWNRNRSSSLDSFVAIGKRRDDSFPYIWTAQGGIEMHPGAVELARAR